jgi:hypothetical protein
MMAKAMSEQSASDPREIRNRTQSILKFCKETDARRPNTAGAGIASYPPLTIDGAIKHPTATPRTKAQEATSPGGEVDRSHLENIQSRTLGTSQTQMQKRTIKGGASSG